MSIGNQDNHGAAPRVLPRLTRRAFLAGSGLLAAGAFGYPLVQRLWQTPQPVFLARGQRYDGSLVETIRDGLDAVGFDFAWVRGRRVLLKPNLVEPLRSAPQMTTHPAMILAAAEVFRRAGASVLIGEASANLRDSELILSESGMDGALSGEKLEFVDLNYGESRPVRNAARMSRLPEIFFPRAALEADLVVSLPKLKTHHWAGFTASMKNLFGLLPGIVYGWPKNVLHHAGIPQTIVDVAASAPRTIGIVDGILCMEGDGPILGTAKPMGVVAVGQNLASLDATLARLIGLDPFKVPYLAMASGRVGPIADRDILQRGQRWQESVARFQLLDLPYLQAMRAS